MQELYSEIFDVVVIGSGPAGAVAASFAAQNDLKVLLIDKKQELGAPIQCSGAISLHALEHAHVKIDDEFIQEKIFGFAIYDESGNKTEIDYRKIKPDEYNEDKSPLGFVVDRRRFDRYLMTQAERNGVQVWLKSEAYNYTVLDDGYCIVHIRSFNKEVDVRSKVVIGADGIQSQVGKWAGINTHIKLTELASCLQFVIDGVETNGLLEIITGDAWAPGGYAWIFPKGHGYAEIGLGVTRTLAHENAQYYLDHFLKNSFLKSVLKKQKSLKCRAAVFLWLRL